MTEYKKPLPAITDINRPFWEATKRHELVAQRCPSCHHLWLPPTGVCPRCLSPNYKWVRLSGRGKVWSWVVFHQAFFKSFLDDIPYNVAYVELEEGPMLTTNLVDVRNEDIRVGMPVEVVFQDVTEEVTLPRFRPRD